MPRLLLAFVIAASLSACVSAPRDAASGSGTIPPPRATVPPPRTDPRPSTARGFLPPRVMQVPGLERVIGQSSAGVRSVLGEPALDVVEGDSRKLQYRGEPCVLDVFLYPLRPGAEPTATFVEARRSSDGLDVDRAACLAALGGG